MSNAMNIYMVSTPEYETSAGDAYGYGDPPEYGCDVVYIEAKNKSDARVLGVELMKKDPNCNWHQEAHDQDMPPYCGIRVEELPADAWEYIRVNEFNLPARDSGTSTSR